MERDLNSQSPVCETGILTTRLPILDLQIIRPVLFYINFHIININTMSFNVWVQPKKIV